jgi:pilus assembly protein CpaB
VLLVVCLLGVVAFLSFSPEPTQVADFNLQSKAAGEFDDGVGVAVIVPADTVLPGVELKRAMFRTARRPEETVGPEIVRDMEEIDGMYSKGLLVAQQPVNRDLLTNLQPINALTASIPMGFRAIAIPVDVTSSVEGWAQPGARVDVFWVTSVTGKRTVSMVAANAKVLSANRRTEGAKARVAGQSGSADDVPHTVTLLLSSKDALRVRLASLHGKLSLVLRGSADKGAIASSNPIPESALYHAMNREPVPEQKRNLVHVKVKDREGGNEEELTFENGQRVQE